LLLGAEKKQEKAKDKKREYSDRLCFVQFHHPVGDHVPDTKTEKTWNRVPNGHRRKFMTKEAVYLTSLGGKPSEGDVVFWGEWEPASLVVKKYDSPKPGEPRYLYSPVLDRFKEADPPYLNTDPFIYGDSFFYGICKQNVKKGPTPMRYLKDGSVILFGSNQGGDKFVLDTVLVVSERIQHNIDNYKEVLKDKVPPQYFDVSLNPIYYETKWRKWKTNSYSLYLGATYKKPYEGMFSFFPCKPCKDGEKLGFVRPVIKIPGVIDDSLNRWQRMNRQQSMEDVRRLWNEVVKQVLAQGLALGVRTDIPEYLKAGAAPITGQTPKK
jgi:hypothetical protein